MSLRSILAPRKKTAPPGWYPDGDGFRYWNGWRWGELRPGASDEVRRERLEDAIRRWARSGYKVQYRGEHDAQLVRGIAGHSKVLLSVNEVGDLVRH